MRHSIFLTVVAVALLVVALFMPSPLEAGKAKETVCDDGVDNDSDGKTDCADPNCNKDAACTGGGGDSGGGNYGIDLKAELTEDCSNCATAVGTAGPGKYSIREDLAGMGYSNAETNVHSNILKHRSVYTLDTLDTLVGGHVVPSVTRAVIMDFFTTASNTVPACWGGSQVTVAVNWSIFSDNQTFFTEMVTGTEYPGRYRLDFNVRNGTCDGEIFRFFLKGKRDDLIITRENADVEGEPRVWKVVTSNGPGDLKFGEADLSGQGGRKGETQDYGTFRLPFEMTLTEELVP